MKTILITGASRGIGRAIALRFAREKYNLALCYKANDESAFSLKKEVEALGASCKLYKFDIADCAECEKAVSSAVNDFGQIDILISNAGISMQKLFTDVTNDEARRIFAVNLEGAANISAYAAKNMIKRHSGKIVFVSSMWGIVGGSMEAHYSASKAALIGLTKALAKELGPSGINVNCVAPGFIETDMNKAFDEETVESIKDSTPLMRIGMPKDVANLVYFLASDEASFVTGQTIAVDGGLSV